MTGPEKSPQSPEDELEIPEDLPDVFTSDKQYHNMLRDELTFRREQMNEYNTNPPDKGRQNLTQNQPKSEREKLIEKRVSQIRQNNMHSDPAEVAKKITDFRARMEYISIAASREEDRLQQDKMMERRKNKKLPPLPPLPRP